MSNVNLIAEARRNAPHSEDESLIMRLAIALEAAEPRVIETVDELDALPVGTIVLDGDKEPFEKTDIGWHCWIYGGHTFSSGLLARPASVIHELEATR